MPPNVFPLRHFSKKKKSFFSSTSTMWSWPQHVSPDPALEKAAGECEQAGHLGGLLDKELLSACPHLRHQAGEGAVEVQQDSLLRATVDKTTRRGEDGPPSMWSRTCVQPARARTTGEDMRDGQVRGRLQSRLCLSCDHCGHISPQRIVPKHILETIREKID